MPNGREEDDPRDGLPGRPGRPARRFRTICEYLRQRLLPPSARRLSRARLIATVYIVLVVLTFSELLLEFFFAHLRLEEAKRGNSSEVTSTAKVPAYDEESWPGRIRSFMLLVIDNVVIKESESSPSTSTSTEYEDLLTRLNNISSSLFNETTDF